MSRCFPYPPPGYAKNGICDEALIESIKLQREGEKAKKERKIEKKREKKEKEKACINGEVESKKRGHKKRYRDERSREDQKRRDCHKSGENEAEQFEKSSLTEEHGHPIGSQNSSDSTLNSNKRRKQCSASDDGHNSRSIIRIRLPLQRHKDPEVLPSKEQEQPCSASERTDDAFVHRMHELTSGTGSEQGGHPCSTSKNTGQELTFRLSKEKSYLSSRASEVSTPTDDSDLLSNLCGSCSPSLALKFRDLVQNWVPPQMLSTDLDNQDWLFETKQKQNQNCRAKRCDVVSVGLGHGNSTPWPRVCYLPEADMYGLPFTVPF